MTPIGAMVVLLVMLLPVLYIAGEIKRMRYLRVGAFVLLLPICVFVAWGVGMLQQFNYNALTEETILRLKSKPTPQANAPQESSPAVGVNSTAAETSETEYEKPAGWTTVDVRGHFSIDLPPSAEETPVQGIDSLVGKYRIGDIELTYDYGAYSSTLEEFSAYDGYARTEVTVDGWPAVLVTTNAGNMGLVFPKVPSGAKLTLHASYAGPESGDIAKKILLSVKFPS